MRAFKKIILIIFCCINCLLHASMHTLVCEKPNSHAVQDGYQCTGDQIQRKGPPIFMSESFLVRCTDKHDSIKPSDYYPPSSIKMAYNQCREVSTSKTAAIYSCTRSALHYRLHVLQINCHNAKTK